MMDGPLVFAPGIDLEYSAVPDVIPIKGQVPRLTYPFSLKSVYPTLPSLGPAGSYARICSVLEAMDDLLVERLRLREPHFLPPLVSDEDALIVLGALFDPGAPSSDALWHGLTPTGPAREHLLEVEQARPFPLRLASTWKLEHTLAWVDSNIKLEVERVVRQTRMDPVHTIAIVEAALSIYTLVMKQQDYWLASSANLNHSMFIQERVLGLILGDTLLLSIEARRTGELSNTIALHLLSGFERPSPHDLCVAGIFMGVQWSSDLETQRRYTLHPESVLGDMDTAIRASARDMAVDDFDEMVRELTAEPLAEVVVILDDNGESVFDLALFQQLLTQIPGLRVSLVVNRWPVSNNIAIADVEAALAAPYFAAMRLHRANDRLRLLVEQQSFRSFELERLNPATATAIGRAALVYIKGANFFETLQLPYATTYHAFTILGDMSVLLTGLPPGSGILVRTPVGETAFDYRGPHDITTLRSVLDARERTAP